METVKVVSSNAEDQGEFVVINKEDYDESIHVLWPVESAKPKKPK
jgi:hypothetical protein